MNPLRRKLLMLGLLGSLLLTAGCGSDTENFPRPVEPDTPFLQSSPGTPAVSAALESASAASATATPSGQTALPQQSLSSMNPDNQSTSAGSQSTSGAGKMLPDELSMYQAFFDGTEKAYVQEGATGDHSFDNSLDEGSEYGLKDILQVFRNDSQWLNKDWEDRSVTIQYTALDLGDDGIPELAIYLSGDLDLDWILMFRRDEGRLVMCYAFATWSRSETSLNYYGFMWGAGSNGAGDHDYYEDLLDKKGLVINLEYSHILHNDYSAAWKYFCEIAGKNASSYILEVTYCTLGNRTYNSYYTDADLSAEDRERFETLCREQMGIDFVSYESVDEQKAAYIRELGIQERWMEEEAVIWLPWKTDDSQNKDL